MEYHHTLDVGTTLDGTYSILSVLGSGGFGNTYRARDMSLQRDVAIKEYFPDNFAVRTGTANVSVKAPSFEQNFHWGLERFVREAQTLATFRHPNIMKVFRTFNANNTSYMVLEFVEGADLDVRLKSHAQPLTQAELDLFLDPMLDALDEIHAKNVLHRDIKPANIYIREADQTPVLLDFGAARYAVSELVRNTKAIVSPGYSPNEAYANDASLQGPWTDIYGLAATLYRSISGAAPPESAGRMLDDTMTPAARLPGARNYRPSFLAAIDHGLQVKPKQRPQSAAEWRTELQQGLGKQSKSHRAAAGPYTGQAGSAPNTAPNSRPSIGRSKTSKPQTSTKLPPSTGPRTIGAAPPVPARRGGTLRRVATVTGVTLVLAGGAAVAALQTGMIDTRTFIASAVSPIALAPSPSPPPTGSSKSNDDQFRRAAEEAERKAKADADERERRAKALQDDDNIRAAAKAAADERDRRERELRADEERRMQQAKRDNDERLADELKKAAEQRRIEQERIARLARIEEDNKEQERQRKATAKAKQDADEQKQARLEDEQREKDRKAAEAKRDRDRQRANDDKPSRNTPKNDAPSRGPTYSGTPSGGTGRPAPVLGVGN